MARQMTVSSGRKAPKNEPRPRRRNRGATGRHNGGAVSDGRGPNRSYLTDPLTPKQVRKEVRASTNQRFRPLERKVGADLRASRKRVGEIGDWWGQYLDTVNQSQAATQAAYGQAATETQGFIDMAGARDASNTAKLNEEAAKSAALRGVAPSTAAAEREAAASAQRSYLAGAAGSRISREGAAQGAYLADQKRIGVGASIKGRVDEQARERSIRQDRRDVARERGEYAVTKRGELRGSERDYLVQRGIAKLDQDKVRMEAREGQADRSLDRREQRERERHNRATERSSREDNERDKGKGGLTPSERRDAREGRRNAVSAARTFIRANGAPQTAKEWAGLEVILEEKSEISAAEAHYAVKKIRARMGARRKKPQGPYSGAQPGLGS